MSLLFSWAFESLPTSGAKRSYDINFHLQSAYNKGEA